MKFTSSLVESIMDTVNSWQMKAMVSTDEANSIRKTIKQWTDAESFCLIRAEVWKNCADEISKLVEIYQRLESSTNLHDDNRQKEQG